MTIKKLFQELMYSNDPEYKMTAKQLNIIVAAIELFSEKGFAATSTSEIAKKAGVAEGTIFRHYKTKKELLLVIPEYLSKLSISKGFIQTIHGILADPNVCFEDFLRAIINNRREFASSNLQLLKIIFQELPFHPELRMKLSESLFSPAQHELEKVIERFKQEGQIVDIPTNSVVNLLITSIFGYMFTRYIAQLELGWDHDKDTDHLIQYIMNGICATTSKYK